MTFYDFEIALMATWLSLATFLYLLRNQGEVGLLEMLWTWKYGLTSTNAYKIAVHPRKLMKLMMTDESRENNIFRLLAHCT